MVVTASIVPSLIGSKWEKIETKEYTKVFNPATGEVISITPMLSSIEVSKAIKHAKTAFSSWSKEPATKRANVMHNYRGLLKQNFNEIARLISTENGKTIAEARGDIQRGFEVVEYACGIAELQKGESLPQVAENIDGLTVREPLGVCAGISPFNFPAMVPMWMFPIAIACGNTFVLKPSEKVPLTAVKLVELLQQAGLPDGVMNLVHGGKEVVDTLCTHPDISAVSFVGSSTIAKYVYNLGSANGKRVQAGGAAKNALVVMPDADPDSTLRAVMSAAFGCAGQRCMAGSLLVGVGEIADSLKERIIKSMDNLKVGPPLLDPNTNMGPVIDKASKERIVSIIDSVSKEAILSRDGRDLVGNEGFFVGPTLFSNVLPNTSIFSHEVFGPVLSIMNPKDLDQAISWINKLNYGNGSSIFTQSGAAAKEFKSKIKCGMVGINVGVPAPMSMFPFSGWNDSFYGDLHMQGKEGVQFYTRQKVTLSRWDNTYDNKSGW
tara:strand:- start:450 stop:1928 length:1479 start_codon:yes stop_codon:yes gene_type:complete